jgi:hypothetical protein
VKEQEERRLLDQRRIVSSVGGPMKRYRRMLLVVVRQASLACVCLVLSPGAGKHFESVAAGVARSIPASSTAIHERFFTGAESQDRFGYSVAEAGDVNGDGFSDVLVGAPYNDALDADAGRVYVYFGGLTTRTSPDVILTGAARDDRFGTCVAGAGDIDGDGYDDLIVGVPYAMSGQGGGIAQIYFGDPMAGIRSGTITLSGPRPGDEFGHSVAGAGDVNGDGWADVIVGAWHSDRAAVDAGCAYLFFGGPMMDDIPDVIVPGSNAGDWLGYAVAGAGDVNRDGYADVIVGAHGSDVGGMNAGTALILMGGPAMDGVADVVLVGSIALGVFGVSVAGAGDANGDGYSDVIVGAERENTGGVDAGRAYVFYGGPLMDDIPDAAFGPCAPGDLFGHAVDGAGDVDGDGYGDLIVSANFNDAGGYNAGRAWIYFGGAVVDETPDVVFTGTGIEDLFGQSAAGAGDVNGDGLADVVVGADYNDAGGYDAGRAYLYVNSGAGTDIPDLVFTGGGPGDQLGAALDGAGDLNGDGYSDLVVGAWSKYGAGSGYARIYLGGRGLSTAPSLTLNGEGPKDEFGVSVAGAGDVNGDGYDDVIIGAEHYGSSGMGDGRACLYFGGVDMDTVPDVIFNCVVPSSYFGSTVAAAGDVNGDGFADVLVGSTSPQVMYLYFGGVYMNTVADMTFAPPKGAFGAAGADVNGDGYSDVILGSPADDAGGTHTGIGRVYVYYGGISKDTTADLVLTGEADNGRFGYSVAAAGDVNRDGYEDIIVGTPKSNLAGEEAGRAYVYLGGPRMGGYPALIIDGLPGDQLGYSVDGCGDVNADGYGDVVVGAVGNATGGRYAGQAYVFYGGAWMDAQADLICSGSEAVAELGYDVAGVGDVNGDGRGDVLVGAVNGGNGGAGIGYGKAFLYLSSSPPIVPRLITVRDVPGDQGGYVRVRWVRSGYDTRDQNRIQNYVVERSLPPGLSGFAWEAIATVPPNNNPQYLLTAGTWCDASEGENAIAYFRVTAHSITPSEQWKSNIVAGVSIDNLAPHSPEGASLTPLPSGSMRLTWQKNRTDRDISHFAVYRSIYDGFSLADSAFLLAELDTVAIDSSARHGTTYYYRITCVDIHANESVPTAQLGGAVMSADRDGRLTPKQFALLQNYPNPCNPTSAIQYALPMRSHVTLTVFNTLGQQVVTLVQAEQEAGYHEVMLDASGLSSGVYLYRLQVRPLDSAIGRDSRSGAGDFAQTKKLVVVR